MQRLKDAVQERQYIPFLNQDQAQQEGSADLPSSHRSGSSVYQTSPSSSSSSSSSSSALALSSSSSSSSSSSFSYNRSLSPLSLLPSSLLSSLASKKKKKRKTDSVEKSEKKSRFTWTGQSRAAFKSKAASLRVNGKLNADALRQIETSMHLEKHMVSLKQLTSHNQKEQAKRQREELGKNQKNHKNQKKKKQRIDRSFFNSDLKKSSHSSSSSSSSSSGSSSSSSSSSSSGSSNISNSSNSSTSSATSSATSSSTSSNTSDDANNQAPDDDNDPEHGTVAERVALRLRPFTTQETERINDTLSRNGNANEILVKEFKVEMTRKIMRDLSGLTWINDEIINYNMAMINARDTREMEKRMLLPHDETNPPKRRIWCAKSFLMTKLDGGSYKDVKRWAKKAKLGGTKNSIFDLWRMVVPINIGNSHWTSVHVDFKTKAILYLDSMGGGGQKYLNLVLNYLKDEHSAKIGTSLDESEWTMKSLGRTIPQQQNCSDCGMFTCTFATYATDTLVRGSGNSGRHGIPFEFGQQDMPYMRRRLALDILSKRLD